MIRLTLVPHGKLPGIYRAFIGDLEVGSSRQPIQDGARALLSQGYSPDTLLVARHVGSEVPSLNPTSIGELAKWTVQESADRPMKRAFWKAMPESLYRREVAAE